jgi:cytochrome c
MTKPSLSANRRTLTLLGLLALGATYACGDDEDYGGKPSGAGSGASNSGGASAGSGAANSGGLASGGNGGNGTAGSAGTTAGGGAGDGGAAPVPVYEQDDPNLHPPDSAYQRVKIPVALGNVMAVDIDEDENVYILERAGKLKIWKPDNTVVEAGTLSTFSGNEDGALSFVLDPNFSVNHWVYIYYSSNDANESKLSRFHLQDDQLHLETESVLLTVPDDRVVQWHVGGGTDFDSQGNLYLALGDNTNPFESQGYSPFDEGSGRALYDAQRTAGNSNDFRGKILRIKPTDDGDYEIPAGNLFTQGEGLPEIYVMGDRNPFRITVDRGNDWLYWGEVGPDAPENGDALATRGPRGYDEFNQAKGAGFFGWPYCIADNIPYVDYDFTNQQSGSPFDCDAPVNDSPNNDGVTNLPAAQPAWIAYSYDSEPYPAMDGGGRTAMAGVVYRWKPGGSINKLPRWFDGSVFLMEYSRGWIVEVRTDAEGAIQEVNPFFSGLAWNQPIHMKVSPSGVLYIAQYSGEPTVYRLNYIGNNNQPPVAVASSDVDSGPVPLTVNFSSDGSSDFEEANLTYEWDFDSDGTVDSTEANPTHVYQTAGAQDAKLTVSDGEATNSATITIMAGNTRPVVTITSPPNGAFVGQGEMVDYTLSVTDAEDGSTPSGIPCSSVTLTPALGHDLHEHDGTPANGCTGTVTTSTGIIASENSWQVLNGTYTDEGAGNLALLGQAKVRLHFKRVEAENYNYIGEAFDVMTQPTEDPEGGAVNVGWINDGSYICWNEMNFQGITSVSYRASSAGTGGRVEIHLDSPTGTQLGSATNIPVTGGWQTWNTYQSATFTDPGGTHKVCFVAKNNPGDQLVFNLNWIDFNGPGVSQ